MNALVSFIVFHGGSDGKESACYAGDLGSSPGSGRLLREGNGYTQACMNPLLPECLGGGRQSPGCLGPGEGCGWWAGEVCIGAHTLNHFSCSQAPA